MSSKGSVEIDLSLWPVVRCTPRGELTDDDYTKMFSAFEDLWKKGESFFAITDVRHSSNASARQRQMIGEWMKKNGPQIKKSSLGSAVIVDSAIIRGALTAINWVAQPDVPTDYVKNWDDAVASAVRHLEKHGRLTDALRAKLLKKAM